MAFLTIERDGGILTATMNQPETRNALTGNTAVQEFVQLCEDVRKDASVKVLIITAAGPIFASRGDPGELPGGTHGVWLWRGSGPLSALRRPHRVR